MKPVLFVGERKLGRAENLTAIWEAYGGPKEYVSKKSKEAKRTIEKASYHGFGAIVTDELMYRMPVKNKRDLKIIMLGHHITGGKAYAYDQPIAYIDPKVSNQLDYFISPSTSSVDIIARSVHLPREKVLALGSPRTDKYIGKVKGDGGTGYVDKTVYLYVPTFRRPYLYGPDLPRLDWAYIDSLLDDDELFVVKRHTYTVHPLLEKKEYKHVVEVSPWKPSSPYIMDCDVLVTDYSSIVFDGYLLDKPSVMFCPDKEQYTSTRFMYHDYPDFYSSKSAIDEEGLMSMARQAKEDGMGPIEKECRRFTADMCDGHAVERIVNLLESIICELVEDDHRGHAAGERNVN